VRLDEQLSAALVRRRPRDGFADRVLARARAERRARTRRRRLGALAAAVVLAVLGTSTAVDHLADRRRAAEAEAARDQLLLALSITSEKLSTVTRTLSDAESPAAPRTSTGGTR
jgi:hypothetical protein